MLIFPMQACSFIFEMGGRTYPNSKFTEVPLHFPTFCIKQKSIYYRENYLFTCDCPKCLCEADEPDVTSDEEEEEEMDEDN